MPLLRHLLARFSANPLPIITKRVSPLRKPTHGAKSGLGHLALSALHHRQFHEAIAGVEDLDGGLLVITRFGQQNVTDVSLRIAIVEREPA